MFFSFLIWCGWCTGAGIKLQLCSAWLHAACTKENHISSQNIGFENFVKYLEKKDILRNSTIEVEDLNQVKILTRYKVKNILLDNFSISEIKKAIKLINRKAKIEVSGNISTKNIQKYKNLNINYISVGDLTKNIKAVDFSLLLKN